mgnify:CR=1 FL=1
MSYTSDEEIEAISRALLARTLPKAEWTHSAHFAAAVWMLARHGEAALRETRAAIFAYNEATGTPNTDTSGYHETITAASLAMAKAYRRDHPGALMFEQVNGLLAGPCGRSDWVFAYWSRERLFTVEARRGWVPPDLQPLPA